MVLWKDKSIRGIFVSGTGTNVGKTAVSRGIVAAIHRRGLAIAALKPLETGCVPHPVDALALAKACARPALATAEGFYRAEAAVSPYAATLLGERPPPPLSALTAAVRQARQEGDFLLVEGAGGVLVPLDAKHCVADLVEELRLPLLLVSPNRLGTLSETFSCIESCQSRKLRISALVLNDYPEDPHDLSRRHNAQILRERYPHLPLFVFPAVSSGEAALALGAETSGVVDHLLRAAGRSMESSLPA